MPNIHDLRRLALQRHKAATRKISRTKAGNGVEISGSDVDPRKSLDFIRSATSKQLQSYVNKLDRFNNRSVQFVPDAEMRPMKKKLWEDYRQAEAARNAAIDANYVDFKDVVIGPIGQTVDERMHQITPLHPHMANMETQSPYAKRELSSRNVASERKLQALIKLRKEQATSRHQQEVLKSQRKASIDMAITIGDYELIEKIVALSDKQFALAWKYTRMSSHLKTDYEFYKDALSGRKGVTNSEMAANELDAVKKYLDWARDVKFVQKSMKPDMATKPLKPKQPKQKKRK
jgi:hypothetical protein